MSEPLELVFTALRLVEQGSTQRAVSSATSDGGRTRGPYRIGQGNIEDVNRRFGTHFAWTDVDDPEKAEQIIVLYWTIWVPEAFRKADWITCARVHNGGPDGHLENATLGYAEKFRVALEKVRRLAMGNPTDLRNTQWGQVKVSPHLRLYEVVSPDLGVGTVSADVALAFEAGREALCSIRGKDAPLTINSGFRTIAHNDFVYREIRKSDPDAGRNSAHLRGGALDIARPAWIALERFFEVWEGVMEDGALGYYTWGVHIDDRPERARWDWRA